MSNFNYCEYCCEAIHFDDDRREYPEDLPDDIPWPTHDTGGFTTTAGALRRW